MIHNRSVHQKIKNVACHLCDFRTSNNSTLRWHVRAVHKKIRNFACELCEFRAARPQTLKKHVKEVHAKVKDYACDQCDYRASRPHLVQNHLKAIHDNIKDLMCDQCDFVTGQRDALKYHVKHLHDPKKVIKCADCDFTTTHAKFLRRHEEEHHEGALRRVDSEGFITCDSCEYRSRNRQTVLRHKKAVHLMIRDQKCKLCNYVSSHRHNLKDHIMREHKDSEVYLGLTKGLKARGAPSREDAVDDLDNVLVSCKWCHQEVRPSTLEIHQDGCTRIGYKGGSSIDSGHFSDCFLGHFLSY